MTQRGPYELSESFVLLSEKTQWFLQDWNDRHEPHRGICCEDCGGTGEWNCECEGCRMARELTYEMPCPSCDSSGLYWHVIE